VGQPIRFEVVHETGAGRARAGFVHTKHGTFETPAFCNVGTKGTVKGIFPRDLTALVGTQVALSNTYHLFLQPGDEVIEKLGGLHTFMGWHGPLVTDSGGFQVFSLGAGFGKGVSKFAAQPQTATDNVAVFDQDAATAHGKLAIVDDEGVSFTSHIDGTLYRFTPERSVEIQHRLGADIFFAFDECTSPEADRDYQIEAMERTHRWAKRSLDAHRRNTKAQTTQALFGIVQGGRYPDLRTESAKAIGALGFDGFGIGGSFSKKDLGEALVSAITPLPSDKPRHLLGIGEPEDLFEGVRNGIDMFDCVLPTRLGRTGTIYTRAGKVDVRKAEYATRADPFSHIPEFHDFSYAYLNHLFRAGEMLGPLLASIHNLNFIVGLLRDIRVAILNGTLDSFEREFLATYQRRA
jgi:queuine tRNA-ribosyltransferase